MIKIENIDVWGFKHAIRGMRNPLNSWYKSDSYCNWDSYAECKNNIKDFYKNFYVGKNDLDLMKRLYKAGTEHRKYLRQIQVSMDIVAPLYWWKEFDTYKVGTTANSCSTMHKIQAKRFEPIDFSIEHIKKDEFMGVFNTILAGLNVAREEYLKTKDKTYWWQMIQLLPTSYNQRRTITMNYENVVNIIHQRENHKLDEWREFVDELKTLPFIQEIIGLNNVDKLGYTE